MTRDAMYYNVGKGIIHIPNIQIYVTMFTIRSNNKLLVRY